tara:strand:- start:3321 stop:5186 length:1866 start_codon:yes stop_codon:yes gene_type:complete
MSVSSELSKLGSGVGRIYLTDSSGTLTGLQFFNDKIGRIAAEKSMIVSATLSSNISAISSVTVTSAGGNITNLSYNGVSVFNTSSPITGATTTGLATALATAINANVSTPSYTAISAGSDVVIYLDPSKGSSLNGTVAAFATTGTAAITATNLDGGTYPTELVDSQIGYRIYINSSITAPSASLVGATDITIGVLRKAANSPYSIKDSEIASGSISVDRDGAVTVINVQTEGSIAADDLTSINAGIFSDGDTIIIRGKEASKVTTVKEGGNIELSNNSDFLTGAKDLSIILQYSTSDNKWYEISRSPGNDLTVASLRSAGISTPVQGVEVFSLTPGGGTVSLTAGVDKSVHILTGVVALTGSWSYNLNNGVLDGDTFHIINEAQVTLGAFSLTVAGVSLTSAQALGANVSIKAVWSSSASAWTVTIVRDTSGVDLVTTSDLTSKENSLGNPASDGDVLSSTVAGVRSWVSNNTDITLNGNAATSSSTAGVLTTLRTVTIPAGTLATNGSVVVLKYTGQFGSNAAAKTLRGKFNGVQVVQNLITLTPNSSVFMGEIVVCREASGVVKISCSLIMNGLTVETTFTQISSLNLDTTSYDVTLEGIGAASSDINIYNSIATKIIV